MFGTRTSLAQAASLSELLLSIINSLAEDPKLRRDPNLQQSIKIADRLNRFLAEAADGNRSNEWHEAEAMALRSELVKINNKIDVASINYSNRESVRALPLSSNGKASSLESIKIGLPTGSDQDASTGYFLLVAHKILDELDSLIAFSQANPLKRRIVRKVKPKKEQQQVVLGILNYFSRVVEAKHPRIDLRLTTEQHDDEVIFVIEIDPDCEAEVDDILYDFAMVVTDRLSPGDLNIPAADALQLQHKLDLAKLELKQTTEILYMERNGFQAKVEDFEKEVSWLRDMFESSVKMNGDLQAVISEIAANNSDTLNKNLHFVIGRAFRGLTEKDEKEIKEKIREIASESPRTAIRLRDFAENSLAGVSGNFLFGWITAVMSTLPM